MLALGGVLLHSLLLYQTVLTASGLDLGFFNALSLVAWLIVLLMVLASLMWPVANLGIVVFPIGALSVALSLALHTEHLVAAGTAPGMKLHILLAILAYSVLAIAAVQAILLAYQDRQLRVRHPGGILRALPPLQTMETLLFQLINLGFFMLSLAIISGVMFLEDMFAQHVAHKTVLSIVAWLIFAVLLWGRWRFGWRGRVAIRWSLSGFAALALAFMGSRLVLDVILQR